MCVVCVVCVKEDVFACLSVCLHVRLCFCLRVCARAPNSPQKAATHTQAGKGVPWFAFGFIAVATFNSIWGIAPQVNMHACMQESCQNYETFALRHA